MPHATEVALRHCSRLRELIFERRGASADAEALREFRMRARAAARAADDAECVELMRSAEQYASDLFSELAHRKWAKGRISGAYILRLSVLGALSEFCDRLALRGVAAVDRNRGAGDEIGRPAAEEHGDS
jgi:hypothetical protein